jgi:hypothetical protein
MLYWNSRTLIREQDPLKQGLKHKYSFMKFEPLHIISCGFSVSYFCGKTYYLNIMVINCIIKEIDGFEIIIL